MSVPKPLPSTAAAPGNANFRVDFLEELQVPCQELDEMGDERLSFLLLTAFQNYQEDDREVFKKIVESLDSVFFVKVQRILSVNAERNFLYGVSDLIAKASSDLFLDMLKLFGRDYGCRWRALLDLLHVHSRIETSNKAAVKERNHLATHPQLWDWIMQRISSSGRSGLEFASLLQSLESGAAENFTQMKTKSGLSTLVSSMKHAGWVTVLAEGRTRRLFAGPQYEPKALGYMHSNASPSVEKLHAPMLRLILSDVVKNGTCYNQGTFLEFLSIATLKHRDFKDAAARAAPQGNSGSVVRGRVNDLFVDLKSYLHAQTKVAAEANFRFLDRYFELTGRSTSVAPRITMKLLDIKKTNAPCVFDLARNHQRSGRNTIDPVGSNTGFEEVVRTGKRYLAQDLAIEVLAQRYKNPRLRTELAKNYMVSSFDRGDRLFSHNQWRSLWVGAESEENFRSAYRSTLIIPLTLMNSPLSEMFRMQVHSSNKFFVKGTNEPIDRVIMGFLCLDHVDANYFDESVDVDIGYMFSDWLSLYLYVGHMLTSMSQSAEAHLDREISEEKLSKFLKILTETEQDLRRRSSINGCQSFTTSNNALMCVDKWQSALADSFANQLQT